MKKVLLLASLLMTVGMFTMAQQTHPKKDTTSKPMHHPKPPKKASDTTHHKKH
jgi:hypothetical protein